MRPSFNHYYRGPEVFSITNGYHYVETIRTVTTTCRRYLA